MANPYENPTLRLKVLAGTFAILSLVYLNTMAQNAETVRAMLIGF